MDKTNQVQKRLDLTEKGKDTSFNPGLTSRPAHLLCHSEALSERENGDVGFPQFPVGSFNIFFLICKTSLIAELIKTNRIQSVRQ